MVGWLVGWLARRYERGGAASSFMYGMYAAPHYPAIEEDYISSGVYCLWDGE